MIKKSIFLPQEIWDKLEEYRKYKGFKTEAQALRHALGERLKVRYRHSIKDFTENLLRQGATNREALAAVRKEYPDSEASATSISFTRTMLRKAEPEVPTDHEARKAKGYPKGRYYKPAPVQKRTDP